MAWGSLTTGKSTGLSTSATVLFSTLLSPQELSHVQLTFQPKSSGDNIRFRVHASPATSTVAFDDIAFQSLVIDSGTSTDDQAVSTLVRGPRNYQLQALMTTAGATGDVVFQYRHDGVSA